MTIKFTNFNKTITTIFLVLTLCFMSLASFASLACASEAKSYDDIYAEYNLKTISPSEVPEYIQPIEITSDTQLVELLENAKVHATEQKTTTTYIGEENVKVMATRGTSQVLANSCDFSMGQLQLWASITTNGYEVTKATEYTQTTGFHLGVEYHQSGGDAEITSSKKDVYVWTNGTIDYYLLINGIIKLYSQPISMDGYIMVFH